MIGSVLLDGEPIVSLDDDGKWTGDGDEAEALAESLNVAADPHREEVGDHHLPFGVACLNRVAARLGGEVKLAKKVEPLPDGAVG